VAIINVSSWDEIANALTNVSEDSTIQLTTDIDMNLTHASGVSAILMPMGGYDITFTGAHAPNFVINKYYRDDTSGGNDDFVILSSQPSDWDTNYMHYYTKEDEDSYAPVEAENYNIRNLRNLPTVITSIIYTNSCNLTLQNLDFQNLVLAGASFIGIATSATGLYVNDCRFVGRRSGESYLFNVDHSDILRVISCYFNIPWMGMNVPKSQLAYTSLAPKWARTDTNTCSWSATYCHFVEHYTGWEIDTTSTTRDTVQSLSFSCECFQLNACKITGDMTLAGSVSKQSTRYTQSLNFVIMPKSVISSYTPSMMSVFDVRLHSVLDELSGGENVYKVYCGNFYGIIHKQLTTVSGASISNTAEWANLSGSEVDTSKTFGKYVRTSQMIDSQSLLNAGFDIILPNE
jgi:hypothetical protein